MSRREFVAVSGGALALGAAVTGLSRSAAAQAGSAPAARTKARIGMIYAGQEHPGWPMATVDLAAEVRRFEAEIAKLAPQLKDVEFVGGDLVSSPQQLAAAQEKMKDVCGVLVIHLTMGISGYVNELLKMGVPVVIFTMPYAGHEWHTIASLQRLGNKIDIYPSSDYADIVSAIRPLRAIHKLRGAKILYMPGSGGDPAYHEALKSKYGIEVKTVALDDLTKCFEACDAAEVAAEANRWIDGAEKIIEPSQEEIAGAARMYLAMKALVEAEQAQAITINCLGSGLVQKGQAYPCIGFSKLSGMGIPGVCEADLKSTVTSLMFQYLAEKPGFVTDPCIDFSKETILHAHCVAPLKMDGPDSEDCPYIFRSHLEDGKNVSLYVRMRQGQKISMARLIGTDTMLFSTGEIVDTPYVDRGCRTKIETKVVNAQKMMEDWSCGLHRVIFYGDHSRQIRRLGRFLDFKVLEEGVDDIQSVEGLEWEPHIHA